MAANGLDHLRIRLVKPQLSLEVHSFTCIHNSLIHSFILFFFQLDAVRRDLSSKGGFISFVSSLKWNSLRPVTNV